MFFSIIINDGSRKNKHSCVIERHSNSFSNNSYMYVVVQFYPWFKFYFSLFLGMIMYDNEFETKEIKI